MIPRVSIAIPLRQLWRTVTLLAREIGSQTLRPLEILVAARASDAATAEELTGQLRRMLGGLPARLVTASAGAGASGGALRNLALSEARADAVLFVEPGLHLEPDLCHHLVAAAQASPRLGFVAPWRHNADAERPCTSVEAILGDPETVAATLFARDAWRSCGGFDETLQCLEELELALRLIGAGYDGILVPRALCRYELGATTHAASELQRERYLPAAAAVYVKHRQLHESHAAAILVGREREIRDLAALHQACAERRTAEVAELEVLRRETEEITLLLRAHGRERVEWGDLRRTTPISGDWGYDRGRPVDRHYIERFLAQHASDIRGTVLEVQENDYTRTFGGPRVERSDVLDLDPANAKATIVADLRRPTSIPAQSYDCVILTQTLHVIDDMSGALQECWRLLRPGGVLLATLPCLSRVCLEYGEDGDLWRVTEAGARHLFSAVCGAESVVEIRGYGNVLTAAAFLYGLAAEELRAEEYDVDDPFHPMLVAVRAVKLTPPSDLRPDPPRARRVARGVVLLYHRVADVPHDPHHLCVSPPLFAEQMRHLRLHCRPLPLADLLAGARAGDLPPGAVAVTFDDGYVDALNVASPILAANEIPATFFIVSGAFDEEPEHWWDLLQRIFDQLAAGDRRQLLALELQGHTWELSGRGGLTSAERRALHETLTASRLAARRDLLRRLSAWSGVDLTPPEQQRAMTTEEVRALAARGGHAIGAHGVHHLALSHQPFDVLQHETMCSKTRLEALLQRAVECFAYPYGDLSADAVQVARAVYSIGVSCEPSVIAPPVDRLRLPRLEPPRGTVEDFAAWLRQISGPVAS